ncbi:hypothetical protein GUJ93_ZPchr0005g14938 [Zizania palustris]|uniref:Uncharacterized protein n=1 Tax=Zizania palustris TaxID=103762 RepID=A0A8J5VQM6_ZIZPA|nr:hypothetical protein GUJ93_ZPchr0005g14938 [Zizania palustris]
MGSTGKLAISGLEPAPKLPSKVSRAGTAENGTKPSAGGLKAERLESEGGWEREGLGTQRLLGSFQDKHREHACPWRKQQYGIAEPLKDFFKRKLSTPWGLASETLLHAALLGRKLR